MGGGREWKSCWRHRFFENVRSFVKVDVLVFAIYPKTNREYLLPRLFASLETPVTNGQITYRPV